MYTFLIVFLISFLKSITDIIKVPNTFNNSYFVRFSGDIWFDPLMTGPESRNPFKKMFRDLWHTCNTLIGMLIFLLPLAFIHSNSTWSYWIYFVAWSIEYGLAFEFWYRAWKWWK